MSPLTQLVHVRKYRRALGAVYLIIHKLEGLPTHLRSLAHHHRVKQCLTDGRGGGRTVSHEFVERALRFDICAEIDDGHTKV